jgi:hypothetical protein
VITTSDREEDIDPRLLSRLQDWRICTKVYITVPPYHGGIKKEARPVSRRKR